MIDVDRHGGSPLVAIHEVLELMLPLVSFRHEDHLATNYFTTAVPVPGTECGLYIRYGTDSIVVVCYEQ